GGQAGQQIVPGAAHTAREPAQGAPPRRMVDELDEGGHHKAPSLQEPARVQRTRECATFRRELRPRMRRRGCARRCARLPAMVSPRTILHADMDAFYAAI